MEKRTTGKRKKAIPEKRRRVYVRPTGLSIKCSLRN
jgi:hypothetical protein